MGFTDHISMLIFGLVMLAVTIFVIMSKVIIGPIAKLKRTERIVLSISLIGVVLVVMMAGSELLLRVLF